MVGTLSPVSDFRRQIHAHIERTTKNSTKSAFSGVLVLVLVLGNLCFQKGILPKPKKFGFSNHLKQENIFFTKVTK